MPTIRFMWVDQRGGVQGYEGEVAQGVLNDGRMTPRSPDFPGPAGEFVQLSDDHSFAIEPDDPAPVFLHEGLRASMETWMYPIQSPEEEVRAVTKVRDAVIQLAESRWAQGGVLKTFDTVTRTERVGAGVAVVGRCVVIEPA